MTKHFFLLSAILLCVSISAFAQTVHVKNELNDFPIPAVALFIEDLSTSALTDGMGVADISAFSDSDSIFFRHTSFIQVAFTKSQLKAMSYDVYLVPNDMLLIEIDVVASNARENARELPYKIDKLSATDIANSSGQNSADILMGTGNIMIQKSQGGGGSPIIRGFEANKLLLVVDGVRMNNAIYRSGHLQNSITIDNSVLDKVNVIYGPASVIYGSDALGGVVHYITKKPINSINKKQPKIIVNSSDKYSTATSAYSRHTDINIGFKKFASLSSFTYSQFGDTKIGKNRSFSGNDPNWGLQLHTVKQPNGLDSTYANPTPTTLLNTGYKQYDVLQKFKYVVSKQLNLTANLQYSTSTEIQRFDNLNDYKSGDLKYAEWYYGPQERLLLSGAAFYKSPTDNLFTNVKAIAAYQKLSETRHTRKFGKSNLLNQNEFVDVYSFNLDFLKLIDISRLSYGLEVSLNDVVSEADYLNIKTNERSIAQTRYPNGGSTMFTAAAYANYKWMINEKNILTSGLRFSYITLASTFINHEELVELPFDNVDITNGAPTGSLSYIWFPILQWQVTSTLSTGFRSPNVDDYGKIRAKSGEVTIPNADLSPEYAYNAELSITKTFSDYFRINATVFNTYLQNALVRSYMQLNGQDSLFYDGDSYQIVTTANAGEANIQGLSITLEGDWDWDLMETSNMVGDLKYKTTFNLLKGRNLSENVPLGHIPPMYGITQLDYKIKKFVFGANVFYSGLKTQEEMSPFGDDNDDLALEEGFPAYYIFGVSAAYKITPKTRLSINIDNIADEHYRAFASGISSPGRNFTFTFLIHL